MSARGPLFRRLLVANRGEIALRVMRTARELGIETVAVYSDADRNALHVRHADVAYHLGPPPPKESYLRGDLLLAAAKAAGCDAVHPGYGFLSENAVFAQACEDAGLVFVGPPPAAIGAMGDKVQARKIADDARVPLVPGLKEDVRDLAALKAKADEIGYPVMLKAAAGGGGKGIRIVRAEKDLDEAGRLARAEAAAAFGDDRVYLEKFVVEPRHVEIQVMADRFGDVVSYGERECSVQRRHQKLVEESPCAVLTPSLRHAMGEAACRLAKAVGYVGAGTVEFLYSRGEFYFLEMNTRLQVEHPVTEMRYGVDLVEEQLRVAAGERLAPVPEPRGHAIEVRINAEDPDTFFPALGSVRRLTLPAGPGVRMDAAVYRGLEVTGYYDSMIGKLIVHGADREHAIARCRRALEELRLVGVATSVPVALRVLEDPRFVRGEYHTGLLEDMARQPAPATVELAALAAAVAKFSQVERKVASVTGTGSSPWKLANRLDILQGRVR
ncbi:MAG: acetyl-CoA carboxylase biotin carboxylase subunit [Planctomycetota bacterium]